MLLYPLLFFTTRVRMNFFLTLLVAFKIAVPSLVTIEETPAPALIELLQVCGITHDGTLADIIEKTGNAWKQQGKERWEMEPNPKLQKRKILELLDELHVIEELPSPIQKFDYAFVQGALLSRVRMRIAFLIKQWERGTRFDKIVLLGGARPINPQLESEAEFLNRENRFLPISANWEFSGEFPKTEAEMMKFVYEQADLPLEMRKIPVEYVNAPMVHQDDKILRPSSKDTFLEWLTTNPKPGSSIFISNQPYIGYHNEMIMHILPSKFSIITIGPKADESTPIEVHLDNLARWLEELGKKSLVHY